MNVVRVLSRWLFIDFDCATRLLELFGKQPSTGYIPPEMACSLLAEQPYTVPRQWVAPATALGRVHLYFSLH